MTKIQGEMNLVISKEVEDVQDAVAKFDSTIIEIVYLEVKLIDGTVHSVKVEDHFINWELNIV